MVIKMTISIVVAILFSLFAIMYIDEKYSIKSIATIIKDNKKKLLWFLIFVIINVIECFTFDYYNYVEIKHYKYMFLTDMLLIIAYIDFKQKIIPNKLLLIMLCFRTLLFLAEYVLYGEMVLSSFVISIISMLIGGLIFLICGFIIKNSIGMGDVKLMATVGFCMDISTLFSCMLSSLILASIVGIVMIILKKLNSKDAIPFAPYMATGTIITLLLSL